MAQHDYNLANQTGADFRADLNNALSAIATVNSGASEPSTTFAHQLWVDTSNNLLKIRNAANSAFITTGVSITASNTFAGALTGNATTATTLETARTINGTSFDGSANISFNTDSVSEGSSNLYFTSERVDDQVNTLLQAGTGIQLTYDDTAGTLTIANTNDADITGVVAGNALTGGGTSGSVTLNVAVDDSSIEIDSDALRVKASGITNTMLAGSIANSKLANSGVTINSQSLSLGGTLVLDTDNIGEGSSNLYYTDARANSAIDARVTNTFINNLSGVVADTSTALATARTIALSGDVVGSVSFDGTADVTIASTIQANSVALGTDTTGNYVQTITGTANKITVSGSGSESADVTLTLPDNVQIADSLTVAGNLTVNGTLTSLDTTNLDIEDNLFQLNAGLTGSPVNDSGMLINRGNQDNGIFMWDESVDKFTLGLTTADGTSTGNITLASLGTLVANVEGNVTGTIQTAAQPNITSLGTLTGLTTTGDINFGDNDKAVFGAGSDLEIYSDGTHSYIEEKNASGNFYIKAESFNVGRQANSELYMTASPNGAVSLYHDNAVKLATTSTGIDVTGNATFDDNGKAIFGAGSDLQIYHDGTNSFINQSGVGSLTISNSNADKDILFKGDDGSGGLTAYFYLDGSESTTRFAKDLRIDDNVKANFGASNDLQIYHDGSDSFIKDEGSGNLRISSNGAGVEINKQTSEYMARFLTDGAVELYHNNSKKLDTTSTGIDVTGTVTNDGLRVDNTDSIRPTTDTSLITISGGNATNSGANYTAFGGTHATLPNIHRWRIGGSEVMRLTSTGLDVTGTATMDGLTSSGSITSTSDVGFGVNSGSNSYIVIDRSASNRRSALVFSTGATNITSSPPVVSTLDWALGVSDSDEVSGDKFYIRKGETNASGSALVIDSSNNIGISTTSPQNNLHVNAGTGGGVTLEANANVDIDFRYRSGGVNKYNVAYDASAGSLIWYDNTANATRMTLDSSGRLGLGTTSMSAPLEVRCDSNNRGISIVEQGVGTETWKLGVNTDGDLIFLDSVDTTASVTFQDGTGNVGIGTSPSSNLDVRGSGSNGQIYLGGSTSATYGKMYSDNDGTLILAADAGNNAGSSSFRVEVDGGEKLRLDSSGRLGLGTTSPDALLEINKGSEGEYLRVGGDNASNARSLRFTSSTASGSSNGALHTIKANSVGGEIAFANGNGNIMYLDVDRNVGIGTDSPSHLLDLRSTTSPVLNIQGGDGNSKNIYFRKNTGDTVEGRIKVYADIMSFETGGSEAGRFDASGNLLVGTTNVSLYNSSSEVGTRIGDGVLMVNRSANTPAYFNRLSTDGTIADFRKDGTSVGSIGTRSTGLIVGNGDVGLHFDAQVDRIFPESPSGGSARDNAIDLGTSAARFKDIYATNGTIQTSDINEKQDIEDLTDAETRVAVAAKSLLKKYRWKSAVEEKGDDARIHFGIMAQDLQNAFTAEGLDAGDYGMFISTTWTDDDGVEQTRLGVRYNELLAFIIAAI